MKPTLINLGVDQSRLPSIEQVTLSEPEKRQFAAAQEHLRKIARQDMWDRTPEGSINAILNKLEPNVRRAIQISQQYVREADAAGFRENLFDKKRTIDDLGLDKTTRAIIDRAETEDAIHSLNERMGTQASQEKIADRPVSLREQLSASFDVTESEGGEA